MPPTGARWSWRSSKVRSELGREYELRIGGESIATGDKLTSLNPSKTAEVVGVHHKATAALAKRAVEEAYAYFPQWSRTPAEERIRMTLDVARILRLRKFEFDAWLVLEAGKTLPEAEAETAEAIDFCEYYAREMARLAGPQPVVQMPGEHDEMVYIPLGVGIVIPPWNFPLAILAGMTIATLVTGNTAIIKPSSETPTIAAKFADILLEAGFPERSFTLLTGSGAAVGDTLVQHPKTRFVAFTGSRDVGLRINELAAKPAPGQIWIKRVVAEMGGKDAIVVDADSDIDKAVEGVLFSAFGYQGQKCSACSRAIVDAKIYDEFLDKLTTKAKAIKVGPTDDAANYMGPVISESARKTILEYIETGKKEGRLVAGDDAAPEGGYFIAADHHRGCRCEGAHFPGGDLRPGAGGNEGERFRARAGTRERHAVRADRRGVFERPETSERSARAVPCGQSVSEPEMHRRDGRRASVRRIQYVGHGFEGRRPGLSAAVFAGEERGERRFRVREQRLREGLRQIQNLLRSSARSLIFSCSIMIA